MTGCYSSSVDPSEEKNVAIEGSAKVESAAPSTETDQKVGFFVDFGKGKEGIRTEVPWKKGLNAISVIEAADPKVTCKYRGKGSTAFLTSIDGVENDLSARKYWIYYVNGEKGKVGAGACQLQPTDKVLWRFGNDEIE